MSGLLDIWREWRDGSYSPKGYTWGSQETDVDISSSYPARTNLDTAGGTNNTYKGTKQKRGQFNTDPKYIRENPEVRNRLGKVIEPGSQLPNADFQTRFKSKVTTPDGKTQWIGPNEQVQKGLTESAAKTTQTWVGDGPWKMRSGSDSKFHANAGDQEKWWNTLANKIGFDYETAKQTWKDKGGFEGLMANPAFTMGLAFLQAGAEGKTIGQGALDSVMKAGGISQHYKKIIEDRKQAPIEVTAADVSDVKDLLATMKVEEPNMFEKAWGFITKGDTGQAAYDQAAEQIASEVQKEIESMQRNYKGKAPFVIDIELKKKVIKKVLKSGKIKHKKSFSPWTSGTVQSTSENPFKAEGGPVKAGRPYVVGEKGPEIIIPTSDGEVLSNDDSQIYAMLLASNPQ